MLDNVLVTVLSVNVGRPRPDAPKRGKTGIFKEPVEGRVSIGPLGLEGDAVCNKVHHGGPDQAVYLYAAEDYAWWSSELGFELRPGTFGENLTTEGLDASGLAAGDRLRIGDLVLEATAPRIPCATLERRMRIQGFVARFMAARRPGAYFRVLEKGTVAVGDSFSLQPYEGERVSLLGLFEEFHHPRLEEAALQRILAAPIAERARKQKEAQLARLRSERANRG